MTKKTLELASLGYVPMIEPKTGDTEQVPAGIVGMLEGIGWKVKTI